MRPLYVPTGKQVMGKHLEFVMIFSLKKLQLNAVMWRTYVLALCITTMTNGLRETLCTQEGDVAIRIATVLSSRSTLIILFDETNENLADSISDLKDVNRSFLKFNMAHTRRFLQQHIQHVLTSSTSVEDLRNSLMFLVVCNDCFHYIVTVASEVDNVTGQQTLRHFSTWFFMTESSVPEPETTLDNIAWSRLPNKATLGKEAKLCTTDQIVATLLWMPEGRTWSPVYTTRVKDEDLFHTLFPNIQRGLNGRGLKIVTLQWIPQTIRKVVNGTVLYVGASIDYIHFLSQVFNFTYRVTEPEDGLWGSRLENSSWTGIIGMLQRKEIDMMGCPYASSASRAEVMDFAPPVYTTEFVVIYGRTRSSLYFWKFLFSGLSWEVYLCFGAVFVCCTMIYMYILYIVDSDSEIQSRPPERDILFAFIGLSLRQDIPPVVQLGSSSERVLLFFWAFFCFLITAIYSGSLVASATVDKYEVPFVTLEDLAIQNEYTVSSYEALLPLEIMENSKNAIYQKLYNKAKKHIVASTSSYVEDGLHHVLKDRYALIANGRSYWAMRATSCETRVMRERIFSTSASFAFPRRSPLVKLFHHTWMWDTGVSQKMQSQWLPASKPCRETSTVSNNQFKLEHLKSIFAVCTSAIGLGVIMLVLEKYRCVSFKRG